MSTINRKMKNDEIFQAMPAVKAAIDNGEVVVIHKEPTSNPEYTNMYFMGKVEGIGAPAGAAEAMFLGWDESKGTIMRCIQNAKTELVASIQPGQSVGTDFTFRVTDDNEPQYKGHLQSQDKDGNLLFTAPVVNESTGEIITPSKPLFRTTKLVSKDELSKAGHAIQKVGVREKSPSTVSQATLTGASA